MVRFSLGEGSLGSVSLAVRVSRGGARRGKVVPASREEGKASTGLAQRSLRTMQESGGGVEEGVEVALPEGEPVAEALLLPQLLRDGLGKGLPEPLRVGLRELEAHRLALLLTLGEAESVSVIVRLPVVSAERERERVGLLLAQRVCVPVPLTVGEPDCVPVLLLLALREAVEEALVKGEKV
jgi:hypothetical protein